MIKPNMLQPGDRVAIVSLSSGMLGDASCRHNMEIGVRRLRGFGLEPVLYAECPQGDRLPKPSSRQKGRGS